MKYGVWFVRLIFAAWMIPAGLNHFIRLFPQPMGSQPLSQELIVALLDSELFALVKIVELVAGIGVLTGFYLPLVLVICLPVSFCVWYWDTPLEGWGSSAAIFGGAVLLSNLLLCLAYIRNYSSMFALRAKPRLLGTADAFPSKKHLVLAGRLIFGAWMLASGLNYFFVTLYPMPSGQEPLGAQLMTALVNSRLLDVAMAIQLVTGALILAGLFVPIALCAVMPISVCAAYWAVILEHQPMGAILALAAVALNGLLMLAYIDYYKGVLQRWARAAGEPEDDAMIFDTLFVTPKGRTARGPFIGALVVLLAALVFYYLVPGLTTLWAMLVLLYPGIVLHARRLQDMGQSPWLLVAPAALIVAGFWLNMASPGTTAESVVSLAALVVSAGFVLWGLIGKGQAAANLSGKPAA